MKKKFASQCVLTLLTLQATMTLNFAWISAKAVQAQLLMTMDVVDVAFMIIVMRVYFTLLK